MVVDAGLMREAFRDLTRDGGLDDPGERLMAERARMPRPGLEGAQARQFRFERFDLCLLLFKLSAERRQLSLMIFALWGQHQFNEVAFPVQSGFILFEPRYHSLQRDDLCDGV